MATNWQQTNWQLVEKAFRDNPVFREALRASLGLDDNDLLALAGEDPATIRARLNLPALSDADVELLASTWTADGLKLLRAVPWHLSDQEMIDLSVDSPRIGGW